MRLHEVPYYELIFICIAVLYALSRMLGVTQPGNGLVRFLSKNEVEQVWKKEPLKHPLLLVSLYIAILFLTIVLSLAVFIFFGELGLLILCLVGLFIMLY